MLFAANKSASVPDLISRGAFFFPADIEKPELPNLSWESFVALCAEHSITSAASVDDLGIELNPACGYWNGRKYFHTRPVYVSWYQNRGQTTGTQTQLTTQTTIHDRPLDRHFAVDLSDEQSFVRSTNPPNVYGTRMVHGVAYDETVTSVSEVNTAFGSSVAGIYTSFYEYNAALNYVGQISGVSYGNKTRGYVVRPASTGNADSLKYRLMIRMYVFNNSGGNYYNQLLGVDQLYTSGEGAEGPIVPTWGLSAFYTSSGVLCLVRISEEDIESISPQLGGNGRAKLKFDSATAQSVYAL